MRVDDLESAVCCIARFYEVTLGLVLVTCYLFLTEKRLYFASLIFTTVIKNVTDKTNHHTGKTEYDIH